MADGWQKVEFVGLPVTTIGLGRESDGTAWSACSSVHGCELCAKQRQSEAPLPSVGLATNRVAAPPWAPVPNQLLKDLNAMLLMICAQSHPCRQRLRPPRKSASRCRRRKLPATRCQARRHIAGVPARLYGGGDRLFQLPCPGFERHIHCSSATDKWNPLIDYMITAQYEKDPGNGPHMRRSCPRRDRRLRRRFRQHGTANDGQPPTAYARWKLAGIGTGLLIGQFRFPCSTAIVRSFARGDAAISRRPPHEQTPDGSPRRSPSIT